jgi:hypothetical protein
MRSLRLRLFAVLLLALAACTGKKPDLAPAGVTFKSDAYPYEISYDLNRWRILAPSEREIIMTQADLVIASAGADHFLSVTAEHSPASLAEMRTRALIALQQRGPDLKVRFQSPVTVAGVPGLTVQVEATINQTPLAFSLVFVQYGGYAYQLAYWSGPKTFLDREADFRDFVASFHPRMVQSTAAAGEVAYPSPQAGYIITLPAPEWHVSRERLSPDADQQFETRTSLAYVMVVSERLTMTLDALAERGVSRLRQSSNGRFKPTDSQPLSVDGEPARVVYGEATVEGTKFQYAILFVVHGGRVYQVAGWAPADLFRERYREQLLDMFRGLQFIS